MAYEPRNPNGQATSANSEPIVIASDQSPVTIDTENIVVKDDFSGSAIDSTKWTVQTNNGSAMTYSIASSILTINAQTTANDYLAFTSVDTFTLPFRAQFIIKASQAITNTNLYLELVNAAGTQVAALGTIGPSTGVTQVAYRITGATATTNDIVAQNQGVSATADAAVTTVSVTSAYNTFELDANLENVDYQTRSVDGASSASSNTNQRNRTILDPSEQYYVQIRCINGGSNPATNTAYTIEAVMVQDATDTPVTIAKGRGNAALAAAIPVDVLALTPATITRSATSTGSPSVDVSFGTVVSHESKSSSANIFAFHFSSFDTGQVVYFQLFNATSATGTPVYSFPVGPAASATQPTVLIMGEDFFGIPGKNFSTALSWGVSTAKGTYSAASTAANYQVNVNYI